MHRAARPRQRPQGALLRLRAHALAQPLRRGRRGCAFSGPVTGGAERADAVRRGAAGRSPPTAAPVQPLLEVHARLPVRISCVQSSGRSVLACFEHAELLRWPLPTLQTVERHALFTWQRLRRLMRSDMQYSAQSTLWRELLRKRVIEHVGAVGRDDA